MNTYVILFRAVNVGGRNRLPMNELVTLLHECGFNEVRTYLQSGNVIIKHEQCPGGNVLTAIETRFGFRPKMLVLDKSEFEHYVENCPFASAEDNMSHLYFCFDYPNADLDRIDKLASETESSESLSVISLSFQSIILNIIFFIIMLINNYSFI